MHAEQNYSPSWSCDSNTIRPNQIMRKQKDTLERITKKQSQLEFYLALTREYTMSEYLTTVTDPHFRKTLTMSRLSEHSLAIEKADLALKRRQAMCSLPTK